MTFTASAELRDKLRRLEFHHDDPYAKGGGHDVENVRLLCRTHNLYLAERDYGKDVMDAFRGRAGRVSEPAPAYFVWTELDESSFWPRLPDEAAALRSCARRKEDRTRYREVPAC